MSNKRLFFTLGLLSLSLGVFMYAVYRDNAYITLIISKFINLNTVRKLFYFAPLKSLCMFIPDFCWCFSLNCWLFLLFDERRKIYLILSITSFSTGVVWELLQKSAIVSGTADILDVLMYLLAAFSAYIIFLVRRKKDEKIY